MKKKCILHIIAVTTLAAFIILGLASTTTKATDADYTVPIIGIVNNANIAVKDYTPVEIVFVSSKEIVDSNGNHTGSKITYEMFMREAVKLQAHDVVNIKVDVNRKTETKKINGKDVVVNTYTYKGMGLAIRYTNAITVDINNNTTDFSEPPSEPAAGKLKGVIKK
ncbi:MAG: hypothetical protein FWB77_01280 [Treponema sp.]|nr:hypothetical protein [Treponema sp.]